MITCKNFIIKLHKFAILIGILLIITGCATKKPADPQDPYESYNRAMFKFNEAVDAVTFKPIAEVYDAVLPNPVKKGIGNAYANVDEVPAIANDVLQARVGWAIADFWRLVFNSTLGVGGLFDVATHFGLKKHRQDLGLTFARWGVKNSPYFVIPLLGPSTIRDGVARFVNYKFFTVYPYLDPAALRWGLYAGDIVNTRAELLPTDKLVKQAFDPYVFVRNAYLQHREHLIDPEQKEAADTYIEEATGPMDNKEDTNNNWAGNNNSKQH